MLHQVSCRYVLGCVCVTDTAVCRLYFVLENTNLYFDLLRIVGTKRWKFDKIAEQIDIWFTLCYAASSLGFVFIEWQ